MTELETAKAVGYKNVTVNEPFFRGHFPDAPVMPGVLVLESLLQLAWVFFSEQGGFRLKRIQKLRFRRPVLPGDRLKLEIEVVEGGGGECEIRAVASVEETVAAQGAFWVCPGRSVPAAS